jgi:DNA-binding FadR family transcriptional regulator
LRFDPLPHSRGSRSDALVERLESAIRDLTPGSRIGTKLELRVQLGVAAPTLNEAVRVLQARGLVESRPGPRGGLFVADQSPVVRLGHSVLRLRREEASVADCVTVLDSLGPRIAREAALRRSEQDVSELRLLHQRMAANCADPVEAGRCDWSLRRRIALISANNVLRAVYLSLTDYVREQVSRPERDRDFGTSGHLLLRVHGRLVEAIVAGDAAAAERAAHSHARLTRPRLLDAAAHRARRRGGGVGAACRGTE